MSLLKLLKKELLPRSKNIRYYLIGLVLSLFYTILILYFLSSVIIAFFLIWFGLGVVLFIDYYYSIKYIQFEHYALEDNEYIRKRIEKHGIKKGFFLSFVIDFVLKGILFIFLISVFWIISDIVLKQDLIFLDIFNKYPRGSLAIMLLWVYVIYTGGFILRQSLFYGEN